MTVKVFIGVSASGEDAEAACVLEYSLRKNSTEEVEITWMAQSHDQTSFWHGWNTTSWSTPFSGYRWAIPAACSYKGRAIYSDVDVIFLGDIAELWRQPIPEGKVVLAKGGGSWRMCVSLWCCRSAVGLWSYQAIKASPSGHAQANKLIKAHIAQFDGDWNCLDGAGYEDLSDPRLKALHYTAMNSQPHLKYAIPRLKAAGQKHWFDGRVIPHPRADVQALFDRLLAEAIEAGYKVENYIPAEPFGDYKKRSLVGYKGRAA